MVQWETNNAREPAQKIARARFYHLSFVETVGRDKVAVLAKGLTKGQFSRYRLAACIE